MAKQVAKAASAAAYLPGQSRHNHAVVGQTREATRKHVREEIMPREYRCNMEPRGHKHVWDDYRPSLHSIRGLKTGYDAIRVAGDTTLLA